MKDELGFKYIYHVNIADIKYSSIGIKDVQGQVLEHSELVDFTMLDLFTEVYILSNESENVIISSVQITEIIVGYFDNAKDTPVFQSHGITQISIAHEEAL